MFGYRYTCDYPICGVWLLFVMVATRAFKNEIPSSFGSQRLRKSTSCHFYCVQCTARSLLLYRLRAMRGNDKLNECRPRGLISASSSTGVLLRRG